MRIVQCDAFGKIKKSNRKDIAQQADLLDCVRYLIHNFLKDWLRHNLKVMGYKINM